MHLERDLPAIVIIAVDVEDLLALDTQNTVEAQSAITAFTCAIPPCSLRRSVAPFATRRSGQNQCSLSYPERIHSVNPRNSQHPLVNTIKHQHQANALLCGDPPCGGRNRRGGEQEHTSAQHDDVVFRSNLIHDGYSLVLIFDEPLGRMIER